MTVSYLRGLTVLKRKQQAGTTTRHRGGRDKRLRDSGSGLPAFSASVPGAGRPGIRYSQNCPGLSLILR